VRVRKDLVVDSNYGREKFVENMKSFIGKVVTISNVSDAEYMILEDDGYCWTDEMFEGLAEEQIKTKYKVGDKIRFKKGFYYLNGTYTYVWDKGFTTTIYKIIDNED
jgi:hypothetical protein